MVPICIYSHSEFFDVLQIQFDYLTRLFKGTAQHIYLFADKKFDGATELNYATILYDDTTPYMQRMATCIEHVPAPYFVLSHENDILLQYQPAAINAVVMTMKHHQIDSVDLRHHNTSEERIEVFRSNNLFATTPTLFISKVPPQDSIIFHVRPRVWNKASALALYRENAAKDYRSAENSNVQNFIKSQKTYEVYSSNMIQSTVRGDFMCNEYVFLHVTAALKFLPHSVRENGMHPFIQAEYDNIKAKYIDGSSRSQAE